jgi:hypothetical protein
LQILAGNRKYTPAVWCSRQERQMTLDRTFRDINGIEWRVSVASPETAGSADDGWLSFEAGWLERRLTPVPKNWTAATIQRLEQMCRIATPVQREHGSIPAREMPSQGTKADSGNLPGETPTAAAQAQIAASDHVSVLANAWPSLRDPRITFRG